MVGYIVSLDYDISHKTLFAEFRQRVVAATGAHGGTYMAREGEFEADGTGWSPQRVALVRFESTAGAKAHLASEDCAELRDIRSRSANSVILVTEGV